jgi:PAS domain S-box-containing protein
MDIEVNGATNDELLGKRAAEWDEPPALVLNEKGEIQDCNASVERLFGYRMNELVWQHISCLFPQLSEVALVQQGGINPTLGFISRCGHVFLGLTKQGKPIQNELSIIRLEHKGSCTLRLILRPSYRAAA